MWRKLLLGDDPLKGSYLNIEKIIEISKKLSIDAIHPGYGFLSENSGFVKKLNKEKNLKILDISIEEGDLEDVFIQLTKN